MSDLMFLVSPYLRHGKIKTQGVLLLPFINSVFLYFGFVKDPHGELWTTVLKCTPIVFLTLYILSKGFDLTEDYRTSKSILFGLIFSCLGDALLNNDLFPHGMAAFAVAQIFYISAFKWTPLKLPIGLTMYLTGAGVVALIFKNLEGVLKIGLPVYTTLLSTMCWRALARALAKRDFLNIFCAFGSILFVISDSLIGINEFLIIIPHSRIWIMTTYYIAQFAIVVSTAKENRFTLSSKKTAASNGSPITRIYHSDQLRERVKSKE